MTPRTEMAMAPSTIHHFSMGPIFSPQEFKSPERISCPVTRIAKEGRVQVVMLMMITTIMSKVTGVVVLITSTVVVSIICWRLTITVKEIRINVTKVVVTMMIIIACFMMIVTNWNR